MKVTLLIAAKNEGEGLKNIIASIRQYADEIILVDGHSTDNTRAIAKQEKVRLFLDNKKGRGDALKIGIREAKGDVIVIFDADGSHEAKDIKRLVEEVKKGADLVLCSRRTGGSFDATISISGMIRSFGADLLTYMLNKRFGTQFTDIIYSFRALNAKSAKRMNLRSDDFAIEQEMVVAACKMGYKVVEIPSREKARAWGVSKLKTLAGIKLFLDLIRQLYF
ncbi:MAG: glycosyltransferase family 2 protein [Patescibacteria group bacterium]|nr:glycosyltransferase family 2 protein [Patescibacteria group bacterium]